MQFQPLVESSPIHQQRHSASKTQPHQDHIRLVRHPQLTGLNRLRSVVQNLTHSFHHFHHHSENFAAISADQAVSSHLMSGHHHIQMGRLRKLAATGILGRFRSSSRTTSDDDEAPAARGSTSHDARFKAELDPTLGDRCGASNSGVTSPSQFLSSQSKGQGENGDVPLPSQSTEAEKLMNGNDDEVVKARHLSGPTTDVHSSQDADRKKQTHQPEESTTDAAGADRIEPDMRFQLPTEDNPARPPSPPQLPSDDSDTDGIRVYKKVSTNGKLVLYLINRDLIISKGSVSTLHAVVTVDAEEIRNKKIFAQILLTFRYGRDDEEVMGLKLSNESILCIEQVYPLLPGVSPPQPLTKCQEVLMKRLGPQAHIINLKLNHTVPASVRLLPAKEYRGAAIGINYDLRVYTAESIEEKPHRRSQIRMAIRLVQYAPLDIQQTEAPRFRLEKHFLLREGALEVDAGLDRQWYTQGSPINVSLHIHNRSSRIVKKIQIRAIQHVDVTMFSNGKFKNTIAMLEETDGLPLTGGNSLDRQYSFALMENGAGRHWVALEDRYGRLTATLASTTLKSAPNERHFFAIYISYYVKVRMVVSGVGGDVCVKIPFVLMRDGPEPSPVTLDSYDDQFQSSRSLEQPSSPMTRPPACEEDEPDKLEKTTDEAESSDTPLDKTDEPEPSSNGECISPTNVESSSQDQLLVHCPTLNPPEPSDGKV